MAEFTYGPVEILLISFDGERPGAALSEALRALIDEKTVTLLDLIFVSRSVEGDLRIVEVEDLPEKAQLPDLALGELGLAGLDDVEELAVDLPPGTSAAVLVVELTWARHFASVLSASGGAVLHQERIPAAVVNAVLDAAV
ncbi:MULTISPECIES: DUF6325 family protein [Cryobacterium]|uniref:DUF1269 domain-containing family protein n=1 Tax=Cryobacterium zongtaii TaxID=1259217 RepID=A0A2S3ZIU2_9MICO|nr:MULTISPECIES: DUF6325 family protein [Cryobacterium]ASD22273.1 hypothetical protein B7495_09355 [Cryobacterium sp. LW097]POH65569.1 hypothetical protein C3B60_11790 [Cryobacterium zongtaii]POH67487.1 hypothetical protein C3B61_06100 [Cryobacterium zongtaii]TFC45270.1 hypothetical protein E3O57_09125 [Cryobacterium sp. TMN-39-2]TFC55571.1 hypothetical protein E3O68_06030 [Cryobacterium sp. TMB3-1-2]